MIPTRAGDRCFRFSGIAITLRAGRPRRGTPRPLGSARLTRIKTRRIDDGKPKYAGAVPWLGGHWYVWHAPDGLRAIAATGLGCVQAGAQK